jgi:hypothetical protein
MFEGFSTLIGSFSHLSRLLSDRSTPDFLALSGVRKVVLRVILQF